MPLLVRCPTCGVEWDFDYDIPLCTIEEHEHELYDLDADDN